MRCSRTCIASTSSERRLISKERPRGVSDTYDDTTVLSLAKSDVTTSRDTSRHTVGQGSLASSAVPSRQKWDNQTPKATTAEDEFIGLSSETYADSFNIANQLFECIWPSPRALSMASVVEREDSVAVFQWRICSIVSSMATCRPLLTPALMRASF